MATDSFSEALSQLDPASRALLDLSLRRGMRPEEIGDLLGTDPESVIVARENALEQLASHLGMDDVTELDGVRARLAELPSEAWTSSTPTETEPEPEADEFVRPALALISPEDAESTEPDLAADSPAPADAARKNRLPLLLALLAVVALALVALLVTRGSGDDQTASAPPAAPAPAASKPAAKPRQPTAKPAAPSAGPKVKLAQVAGSAGAATATASLADGGKRLLLDVKGLPDPGAGSYQVWLYDSVIDAQSIGSARGRDLNMDLKLPGRASHFSSVDVSLEPNDGNANHSGQSVLRAPLSKLSR